MVMLKELRQRKNIVRERTLYSRPLLYVIQSQHRARLEPAQSTPQADDSNKLAIVLHVNVGLHVHVRTIKQCFNYYHQSKCRVVSMCFHIVIEMKPTIFREKVAYYKPYEFGRVMPLHETLSIIIC